MTSPKIPLKVVIAPAVGVVLEAPPVLMAIEHSVDYTCGRCAAVLLHADEDQVHGVLIRCTKCGSYNSTGSLTLQLAALFISNQAARCPLLAQSGHRLVHCTCPLSGAKRTCRFALHMSAFDPKRTFQKGPA